MEPKAAGNQGDVGMEGDGFPVLNRYVAGGDLGSQRHWICAPTLDGTGRALGSVVDERRLLELPTNGRNFAQTATLQAAVVYGTTRMGVDGQQTMALRAMPGQIVGLSANGQRDLNQNITLDGVSAVDGFKNAMLFVPSIELSSGNTCNLSTVRGALASVQAA